MNNQPVSCLQELLECLERITGDDFTEPSTPCPPEAVIIGVMPDPLRRIYTAFAQLCDIAGASIAAKEEAAEMDALEAAYRKGVTGDALIPYLTATSAAKTKLSPLETMADLAWNLLLAESARVFPSSAYADGRVGAFSGWILAALPEEDDEEEGEDDELTGSEAVTAPVVYNH